ncbi:MAG: division/cell wall cluster transcriptional repressor MraZ [Chloroflexi bacterium]|nr:division/cell wall cluster transcriptional repressor MraZ [Chloroflexota bacterium]
MIFSGEYEHRIDSQGRLAIPARFRAAFADGLVLGRGYDPCITAYSTNEWQKLAETMRALPETSAATRRLNRLTFAGAYPGDLDRQGRTLIPAVLRQYAGIAENVVVAGAGKYLEIWSSERWRAERQALDAAAAEIAERAHRLSPSGAAR